ncbi:hypothetical protein BU25DRAFT_58204 [Macroventuria anomochaeta]|uniref:Uncharacterized protein n=1 Tax=Macroventuria anomochaeta TaxID=301207 RepID=A0ACB6S207_9PLEO|nr:uncharacterized protein BU25DRAFT_58204 [Macroventuria anomochaeta]KAF2627685.1 hypothetical protein BU25DRAFT_58204 [Macroventuria anomochaeta]
MVELPDCHHDRSVDPSADVQFRGWYDLKPLAIILESMWNAKMDADISFTMPEDPGRAFDAPLMSATTKSLVENGLKIKHYRRLQHEVYIINDCLTGLIVWHTSSTLRHWNGGSGHNYLRFSVEQDGKVLRPLPPPDNCNLLGFAEDAAQSNYQR